MKALSKPLSSPGRTDKFPPPLMRFLRSNVGSRSRGRSRSSPMFYLRTRKSLPGPTETHQEPSSPKVTCIGQVRVRRSSKSKVKKPGTAAVNRRRRCRWLKKTLFCGKKSLNFSSNKRPFLRIFNKWGSFFRSGYCKKVDDATEDSLRAHRSNQKIEKKENVASGYNNSSNNRISSGSTSESDYSSNNKYENLGGGSLESRRSFLESSSSSPPKNALLLTRCRSAPYRSSSLGGIFWGSAFARQNVEENDDAENQGKTEENVVEDEPIVCRKSSEKSERSVEDSKAIVADRAVHPLLLTRCKSEPARTGERLNQESIFLRQIRLDVVDPRSQQNS